MLKIVHAFFHVLKGGDNCLAGYGKGLLLAEETFRKALEVERERSDRSGLPFSLLVYELEHDGKGNHDLALFEKFIKKRLRTTDSVGWMDKNHIAIAMFNTDARGANVLANEIKKVFLKEGRMPLQGNVNIYPPDRQRGKRYSHDFHQSLNKKLLLERERSNRSGLPFSVLAIAVPGATDCQQDIERLKEFLFQRMRATDNIGWVDDEHIGVTMFNTTLNGAWVLASEIEAVFFAAGRPTPEMKIFMYQNGGVQMKEFGSDSTIQLPNLKMVGNASDHSPDNNG
jgi:hypothetical protein